jgi:quercetin dioxygenase-like cupin family protein
VSEVDERSGHHVVDLVAGQTVVIPAGVWHTVDVVEPARTLHVTFGRGTRHRSR